MNAAAGARRSLGRRALSIAATLAIVACTAWAAAALWFQAGGGPVGKATAVFACVVAGGLTLLARHRGATRAASLAFALAFAAFLSWWHTLAPSNERVWADDVARMSQGHVDGDSVVVDNVRDFDWRSDDDYTQRWETRRYDLATLASTDLILSYWSGRAIAHMIVSFGFDDGRHLAFSVEVRREKAEAYSELGGFFKAFELSVIAADERDVVRVRTNVRGEDEYLYRVRLPKSAMRALFLAYVDEANRLTRAPRFYDTITANCTTLVWHMMEKIVGHLPLDPRLLLTGYLPGYVYGLGALDVSRPLDELRRVGEITSRARATPADADFSAAIRAGIPALPAE